MKKSIILLVILIVVVILAVVIALTMLNPPTPQQNLSENGTKLNLQNNNQQYWQHMDIVIENVTLKNGTVENFYIEAWVKPGENLTIDLSQLFGYGNERLPTNYTIRPKVWGGMFNDTSNTGNNTFDMVLFGWSNSINPPSDVPKYNLTFNNMPLVQLPSKITGNMFYWNNTKEGVDNITRNEYPHDDINEILFTEITLVVDSEGNIIMTFDVPPTLCETIAHIISV